MLPAGPGDRSCPASLESPVAFTLARTLSYALHQAREEIARVGTGELGARVSPSRLGADGVQASLRPRLPGP